MAWPLCFTYSRSVIGTGFIAHVSFCGRTTAVPEPEGVWLYGVNPGAIAVGGVNLADAHKQLHESLTKTLIDFAAQAQSFDAFKAAVEDFYNQTDDDLTSWEEAVAQIKAGQVQPPDGIRRCPDPELFVKVVPRQMEQLTPADNPLSLKEATADAYGAAA
jgi:hypothetical protein